MPYRKYFSGRTAPDMTGIRKFLLSALFPVIVLLVGLLTIYIQLWQSHVRDASSQARHLLNSTDTILKTAGAALDRINSQYVGRCLPLHAQTLDKEVAKSAYLYSVIVGSSKALPCRSSSAIQEKSPLPVSSSSYEDKLRVARLDQGNFLFLQKTYAGSELTGAIPLIYFQNNFLEGTENHSVAIRFSRDTFVTSSAFTDHFGDLSQAVVLPSEQFRYSIVFIPPALSDVSWRNREWLIPGIMVVLISFLSGLAVWIYLNHYTTPFENLKKALLRNEIKPWYQPVVHAESGQIHGFEVLARWKHPTMGYIAPDNFIPMAERSGLIIDLTSQLFRLVTEDLSRVKSRLPEGFHVGINVSARYLHSANLLEDCLNFINFFAAKKLKLVLEITEREHLVMTPACLRSLLALKDRGVTIALDDFGTGYSGISSLQEMQVDFIKIDRSFVGRINSDPESTRLIECVIDMANTLSLSIVAEGVETALQKEYLRKKGIEFLQGYFFSRPLSFGAFAKLIFLEKPPPDVIPDGTR